MSYRQHLFSPEGMEVSEQLSEGFLQDPSQWRDVLPQPFRFVDGILQELLMDVFDEVDRRGMKREKEKHKRKVAKVQDSSLMVSFPESEKVVMVKMGGIEYIVTGGTMGLYIGEEHYKYVHTCTHIYTKIYVHTCIYIHVIYMYIHTYVHTYIHIYTHTYIQTLHTYIHTHIHTYTHTYNIHTHTCIHTYIHTYIRTYIYTYTHTYILTGKLKQSGDDGMSKVTHLSCGHVYDISAQSRDDIMIIVIILEKDKNVQIVSYYENKIMEVCPVSRKMYLCVCVHMYIHMYVCMYV